MTHKTKAEYGQPVDKMLSYTLSQLEAMIDLQLKLMAGKVTGKSYTELKQLVDKAAKW